jgi:hypothetical protein
MELSSGQQRLLFVVVVLALAGLGIWLVGSGIHHGNAASPPASPSASSAAGTPAASSAPPTVQPASGPATPAATGGGANIYQWLPFSQQDLTEASQATLTFAADYETFSYTETDKAYAAKMANVVTPELAATLKNAYDLPGAVQARSSQKQVSTSTGGIASIRSFGAGSITFLVNIGQKLATTSGTTANTAQYAVTVISSAGGWAVNDIELAKAGNF